jgi:putative membrane protein
LKRLPFLWRVLVSAIALWVVTLIYPQGLRLAAVAPEGAIVDFLLAGLLLAVADAVLRPVLLVLALPFTILTLGLFSLVVNAVVLAVVAALTRLDLGSLGPAIVAALLVTIASALLAGAVRRDRH